MIVHVISSLSLPCVWYGSLSEFERRLYLIDAYMIAPSTRIKTTAAIQNMNMNRSAWSEATGPAVPNVDWILSGVHAARRTTATGIISSRAVRNGNGSFETRCIW